MFKDSYDNTFYECAIDYLRWYDNYLNKEKGKPWFRLEMLNENVVPKEILSTLYFIMLKNKMIEPIEKMSPEDKEALWQEAKPYTQGMNRDNAMKVVRAVWALSKLGQLELQR